MPTLPPINPTGVFTAWTQPTDSAGGPGRDAVLARDPGDANPPIIFEPDPDLAGDTPEVWIMGSGGPFWGGAQVHVSLDGTTYSHIGWLIAGASQGVLTAPFPAGPDPDTVNTLSVDLSMSRGQLLSGTEQDADFMLPTLCYCDGEFVAFSNATLTGLHTYDLDTYIRRGTHGTAIEAHAAGTQFCWIQAPYSYEYPASLIGETVWFKFPSFNTMGANLQALADCEAYPYTLTGAGLRQETLNPAVGAYRLPLVTGLRTADGGPVLISDPSGQCIGVLVE